MPIFEVEARRELEGRGYVVAADQEEAAEMAKELEEDLLPAEDAETFTDTDVRGEVALGDMKDDLPVWVPDEGTNGPDGRGEWVTPAKYRELLAGQTDEAGGPTPGQLDFEGNEFPAR